MHGVSSLGLQNPLVDLANLLLEWSERELIRQQKRHTITGSIKTLYLVRVKYYKRVWFTIAFYKMHSNILY